MKELKTWCDAEKGRYMQLARHLQRVPSFVTKMASGEKPVPLDLCGPIEALTGIPCEQLRPDQVAHFAYMRTRPTVEASTLAAIEETNPILKAA
jgi:DNA-binding transcriptional regulator YdaS (Cro superfamily)